MGGTIPSSLGPLHARYLEADALAYHYQVLTYRTLRWMFILGFLTAVFFELNAHVIPHLLTGDRASSVMLALTLFVYLCLWGVIRWLYRRAKRDRYQENFHSYRALAEGLRVQFFWLLVGITDSIGEAFETRDTDEDEALPVLKVIAHLAAGPHPEMAHRPEREVLTVTQALVHWVEGQERYFTNAVAREERRRKWCQRAELGCFVLALLLPAWLMVAHFMSKIDVEGSWRLTLIVTSALAMVGAGLFHGYGEKRAFGEHSKSYGDIWATFDDYKNVLRRNDSGDVRDSLREFGKTALRENADWVRLHRWRPLDAPRG